MRRERAEDEGKLAALREGEGEQERLPIFEAEGAAEREEDDKFKQQDGGDEAGDRARFAADEGEVDARAHGDKKEAQEQALERLEIGLELRAVFTFREDHAGEESPERGRETHALHEQGDADHEQEGGGGEHLAQARRRDVTQERPEQETPRDDHRRDRREHDQAARPGRQARLTSGRAGRRPRAAKSRAAEGARGSG